jgi:cytochrome c biogenesis protein CcdA
VVGLLLLVAAYGLFDSLNPTTIAVAVLLATTPDAVRRLAGFTAGVFAIYLAGGALLTFGPAELLRAASEAQETPLQHIVVLALGVGAIVVAIVLWTQREKLREKSLPSFALQPHNALFLGAVMTGIDLPTALPYFGAILAITGGDASTVESIVLLVVFNLCYVLPLIVILVVRTFWGDASEERLERLRDRAQRWAPVLLPVVSAITGVALVIDGGIGLLRS